MRTASTAATSANTRDVVRTSRFQRIATSLLLIVIVALLVRLAFLWDYKSHNSTQAVSVIPFLFESGNIAHSLAIGHGFASPFRVETGPTAWMTPLYPLILAAIFKIFGSYTLHAWLASVTFNIVCVVLACVPIYFAGIRIGEKFPSAANHGNGGATNGNRRALGALAAWLWAIFPNAILMPVESMWEASLAALLGATILWATLALDDEHRGPRAWLAYGLLWGATLMTNATLGALLPFLLGWLWWRRRKDPSCAPRAMLTRIALTLAVAALCCVPWTIRNYRVFHAVVPLRSVLGLQLWLGNNDATQDVFRGNLHPIYNATEREHYIAVGELAYMQEKKQAAVAYMLANPAREAHLIATRFVGIWAGGSTSPLADFVGTDDGWFRFVLSFNVLAAFGTVAGILILFLRRNPTAFPVAIFPLIFPWAYYLTLSLPRYRLPIDPILMLLLAITLRATFLRIWLGDRESGLGNLA